MPSNRPSSRHQTQSKNQTKLLQSQTIDVQEYNAKLERRIEELSSSANRRSNHRRHYNQNPKPADQSDPQPSTNLSRIPPPVELQPTSSTTCPNSAPTSYQIIWETQKSTTESDIMKVVSPPGALSNTCKPLVIRRTHINIHTHSRTMHTSVQENHNWNDL